MSFPTPGTTIHSWIDDATGAYSGDAVVLATSRHKARISEVEALDVLKATYGPDAEISRTATWRTVTRHDMACGMPEEIDGPGDLCEAGTGAAWVEVAYPSVETVNA